jgi:hypothetical protein
LARPPPPEPPDKLTADQKLRAKIVAEAKWGRAHEGSIHYRQQRPIDGINRRHKLPLYTDCSGFVTLCYKWAGAPDPNGRRYDGYGYTGTLKAHMRHISKSQVKPGDLCLWEGQHVALVIKAGADPLLISHGSEHGPNAVRFSVQNRYHKGRRVIWLTTPRPKKKVAGAKPAMGQQAPSDLEPSDLEPPVLAVPVLESDPPSEENLSPEDMDQSPLDS